MEPMVDEPGTVQRVPAPPAASPDSFEAVVVTELPSLAKFKGGSCITVQREPNGNVTFLLVNATAPDHVLTRITCSSSAHVDGKVTVLCLQDGRDVFCGPSYLLSLDGSQRGNTKHRFWEQIVADLTGSHTVSKPPDKKQTPDEGQIAEDLQFEVAVMTELPFQLKLRGGGLILIGRLATQEVLFQLLVSRVGKETIAKSVTCTADTFVEGKAAILCVQDNRDVFYGPSYLFSLDGVKRSVQHRHWEYILTGLANARASATADSLTATT